MLEKRKKGIKLDQDQNLLGTITHELPIGIYRTSIEGNIIYANQALANMLEYSMDEIKDISVSSLYATDNDRDEKIKSLKTISNQELNLRTKTGKIITVKDTLKVVKNEDNEIIYLDGILEDITEQKKAEKALKESEARYKILTDLTIEGIIIHKKGIILDVNSSAQKMTGYTSDFVIGKSILDFIHPNSHESVSSKLKNGFIGIFEIALLCADQSSLNVEIEAKNVIIDQQDLRVVALRDITDRKKTESEILTLSTAIRQSPVSIVITNTEGIMEYVNPKFTEITGYKFDEAVGKNPNILKTEHTKSEDYQELWKTILQGKTWTGEFLNKRKNGEHYWELASISPIIDDNGNTIKYVAVKEDITKRKNTQEALKHSEKELSQANATKNVFFSIIAHDLKGPIGNFTQLLNLFKENFNDISNEERLDYINILSGLSIKTNHLLDDLLLWAKIQMNTIEFVVDSVNLKSLVRNSIGIVEEKAREKKIILLTQIDDVFVNVNESSIKTIIRNLLSNAIKFSHKNNQLIVKSRLIKKDNIVEIAIKDQGVGISKESLNHLFKIESSFSTYGTEMEKGSGLGLILCKELVEKNGGKIWVESEENVGSTFFFTLPLQK